MLHWLGLAIAIVLFDQISKVWISHILHYGQAIRVTSFFNLILVYNEGAAFSFLASQSGWQRYFFTAISILAIVVIVYLLKKHAHQRLFCLSLALILGGAIGNLIDRSLYGHVIDFLDDIQYRRLRYYNRSRPVYYRRTQARQKKLIPDAPNHPRYGENIWICPAKGFYWD